MRRSYGRDMKICWIKRNRSKRERNLTSYVMDCHGGISRSSLTFLLQYYRPWELSNAEEDRVADQVDDVRDLIKGELAEFERKKEERLKALENPPLDEGALRSADPTPNTY
jgi:hypothetical protein